MEIRPVDNTARIVEATNHHEREHPQKRQQPRKKERIAGGPIYKPNGTVEEEPPPRIDVLV